MRLRALIRLGIRSAAAVTTVGILAALSADAGSLAEIRERGELVMVCFPRQASHFVRVDLEKGAMPREGTTDHFQGIDVDLMAAFAAELGVRLTIRPITEPGYGELIPTLLAGQADVIASSFTVTPEREGQVDFSIPYFVTPGEDRYAVAVAPGSELLEPLNRFLAKLRDSGELQDIIRRYISAYEQEQVIPQPEESSSAASCASVCRLDSSGRVPTVKVGAAAAC